MENTETEDKDYLLIAGERGEIEVFSTLEGEGKYVGMPSVFLRLFGCNLTCKGFISPSSPWGCDSYISWSVKNKRSFQEVGNLFERDFNDKLKAGAILKISGGEPFLRQEPLINFIGYFQERFDFLPKIDFETNATIEPDLYWVQEANATFTTSPKLANNGDPESRRYKPEVLDWHALNWFPEQNEGSIFKFVVSKESDIDEIFKKYIDEFDISRDRVWFMPCCGSRQEHLERGTQVAEWCKQYGVNFSPRLHLLLWDKALRV